MFIPFTTYEKTSFSDQVGRSFTNGFSGPKSFRGFLETHPSRQRKVFIVIAFLWLAIWLLLRQMFLEIRSKQKSTQGKVYSNPQYRKQRLHLMGSWCSVKGAGREGGGGYCQAVNISYHWDNSLKWSELNLNNLVPLANILLLIVVKLSFVVKGLLSEEPKVPCQRERETGKFDIRWVEGGQITTAKR